MSQNHVGGTYVPQAPHLRCTTAWPFFLIDCVQCISDLQNGVFRQKIFKRLTYDRRFSWCTVWIEEGGEKARSIRFNATGSKVQRVMSWNGEKFRYLLPNFLGSIREPMRTCRCSYLYRTCTIPSPVRAIRFEVCFVWWLMISRDNIYHKETPKEVAKPKFSRK